MAAVVARGFSPRLSADECGLKHRTTHSNCPEIVVDSVWSCSLFLAFDFNDDNALYRSVAPVADHVALGRDVSDVPTHLTATASASAASSGDSHLLFSRGDFP